MEEYTKGNLTSEALIKYQDGFLKFHPRHIDEAMSKEPQQEIIIYTSLEGIKQFEDALKQIYREKADTWLKK